MIDLSFLLKTPISFLRNNLSLSDYLLYKRYKAEFGFPFERFETLLSNICFVIAQGNTEKRLDYDIFTLKKQQIKRVFVDFDNLNFNDCKWNFKK